MESISSQPICVPPNFNIIVPNIKKEINTQKIFDDVTPPTPPGNLKVYTESIFMLSASWDAANDSESGIGYYVFALGRKAGEADIRWWQSNVTNLSCSIDLKNAGIKEGDIIYFSVRAVNNANLYSSIVTSDSVVIKWEILGESSYDLNIAYSGSWRKTEIDSMKQFLNKMLPVIKEVYGPPSHSYTVTLVKDSNYQNSNVFFSGPNEVHMFKMYPQLLTHELIHAFRDNFCLSGDSNWLFNPVLSGFEESFAQEVSYDCMNRYIEKYPNDPIVPYNSLYGSSNDWDYDFQNTDILTTEDFWSDGGGTGLYWLRYEMGAAAMNKVFREYPTFFHDFNSEYYRMLNSNHNLVISRELIVQIIKRIAPKIEGRLAEDWINHQRIFDCIKNPGYKIFVRTQHYPYSEFIIFQLIFYMKTFTNGSEWSYWDNQNNKWVFL